jgi:cell division protein FtsI/penicillin-binding protein 2
MRTKNHVKLGGVDRMGVITYGMLLAFVMAAGSQAKVQLMERQSIMTKAEASKRFSVKRTERAKRGQIFTSDMKMLAGDDDDAALVVDFSECPNVEGFWVDLSSATGIPASEFMGLAQSGVRSKTWADPMSAGQQKQISDVKRRWRANGVSTSSTGRRVYPLGLAFASIVGIKGQGHIGLEGTKEDTLRGKDGVTEGLIDRQGQFLPTRMKAGTMPREDGKDIVLTLDSELQVLAMNEVKNAVTSNNADFGIAYVADPKTGDILAMASWPTFDPEKADGGSDFNPNTMLRLEPGSTFKILTLAEALDKGVLNDHSISNCGGTLSIGNRTIHCDDHGSGRAHGSLTNIMAIAKSCNVSAANWALKIGRERYLKFLTDLGIFERPNLGLPNEKPAIFNREESAKQLQLATVGFGQSINVTPARLGAAFLMLGNHGERVEPRLIRSIGGVAQPVIHKGQVIKPESAEQVLDAMEAVIQTDQGTGKTVRIPGYRMGGKTGTAQRIGAGRTGYVSNFVGFVPSKDPKVMILVMVDNPKAGKYYGADVAGPVFLSLAKAAIRRLNIPPSRVEEVENVKVASLKSEPKTEKAAKAPDMATEAPRVKKAESPTIKTSSKSEVGQEEPVVESPKTVVKYQKHDDERDEPKAKPVRKAKSKTEDDDQDEPKPKSKRSDEVSNARRKVSEEPEKVTRMKPSSVKSKPRAKDPQDEIKPLQPKASSRKKWSADPEVSSSRRQVPTSKLRGTVGQRSESDRDSEKPKPKAKKPTESKSTKKPASKGTKKWVIGAPK